MPIPYPKNFSNHESPAQLFYLYFVDDDKEKQYVYCKGYRDYQILYGLNPEPSVAHLFSGVPDKVMLMLERQFSLVNLQVEIATRDL
jgi:hypothetical protein